MRRNVVPAPRTVAVPGLRPRRSAGSAIARRGRMRPRQGLTAASQGRMSRTDSRQRHPQRGVQVQPLRRVDTEEPEEERGGESPAASSSSSRLLLDLRPSASICGPAEPGRGTGSRVRSPRGPRDSAGFCENLRACPFSRRLLHGMIPLARRCPHARPRARAARDPSPLEPLDPSGDPVHAVRPNPRQNRSRRPRRPQRVHAHRAAGGDLDHRAADRHPAAGAGRRARAPPARCRTAPSCAASTRACSPSPRATRPVAATAGTRG